MTADLVVFFLAELERRVPAMEKAWDETDLDELRRQANELRGTAGSCGYPRITTAAGAVEEALAREADVSHVREQMEDLLLLCRRACQSEPEAS